MSCRESQRACLGPASGQKEKEQQEVLPRRHTWDICILCVSLASPLFN